MGITQNYYLYGTHKHKHAKEKIIVVYHEVLPSNKRTIGSLEGIFVSSKPLIKEKECITEGWEFIIKRKDMEWFEEKYRGKFYPLNKI